MSTGINILINFLQHNNDALNELKRIVQYFKDGKRVYDDHNYGTNAYDTNQYSSILVNICHKELWCSIAKESKYLRKYRYHCRNPLYWDGEELHQSSAARSIMLHKEDITKLVDNGFIHARSTHKIFRHMDSIVILLTKDMFDCILTL